MLPNRALHLTAASNSNRKRRLQVNARTLSPKGLTRLPLATRANLKHYPPVLFRA